MASLLALAAVLCGSRLGPVPAGADPAAPPAGDANPADAAKAAAADGLTLEDVLTAALRNNPDVRVAEAKVREAEAELQRVRVQVIQKMVKLQADLQAARQRVKEAEGSIRHLEELVRKGYSPPHEVETARSNLQRAKGDLAALEAEVPYVLGPASARKNAAGEGWRVATACTGLLGAALQTGNCTSCHAAAPGLARFTHAVHSSAAAPPRLSKSKTTDAIRRALDGPVPLKDARERPLKALLQELQAGGDGFPYLLQAGDNDTKPVQGLKWVPTLGAYLLAVEDMLPEVRFAVREYGVLVTTRDRVPEGAVTLRDFLRQE
jgi:hypothetical protein